MVNLSFLILIDRRMFAHYMKGLLHTIKYQLGDSSYPIADNDHYLLDLTRELTEKLQKMVRQGSIVKVVGFDLAVENQPDSASGAISGRIKYYSPTKARCDAWREAFKATQKWKKIQGISPNYNYDFRVGLDAGQSYAGAGTAHYQNIANNAWLELDSGSVPQALALVDSSTVDSKQSLFDVWNLGIEKDDGAAAPTFGEGWHPYMPVSDVAADDMDFVMNETAILVTNPNGPQYASLEYDEIPFSCAFGTSITNFKWRPVTGEYIPVMCGLLDVHCADVVKTGEAGPELTLNVHVAGWYPILKRRKSRRKFRGRRRRK